MNWHNVAIVIGLVAQLLFSARLIIQWIKTEESKAIQSPTIFWILSLIASFLLIVYGLMRKDIVIIGGQIVSYYIYIRNLQIKQVWSTLPFWLRQIFLISPFASFAILAYNQQLNSVIHNDAIPKTLFVWGSIGQAVFTLRFVYQWFASERLKRSVLPLSFWIISIIGAIMIMVYAVFRRDFVIMIGQTFGLLIYVRNLVIGWRNQRKQTVDKTPYEAS